jgi:hypothetical protein
MAKLRVSLALATLDQITLWISGLGTYKISRRRVIKSVVSVIHDVLLLISIFLKNMLPTLYFIIRITVFTFMRQFSTFQRR